MDETFFKYLVENQNKWCCEYYINKEKQNQINIIQKRRYKSRGNQSNETIQEKLINFYNNN